MPRSNFSASARLSPLVYSGNGCVEMRMPATSYPAFLMDSRTWLRNFTASSICCGYDFASMVMKPVMARTFGFGRSAAPGAGQTDKNSSAVRMQFERVIVLDYAVSNFPM